MSIMDFGTDNVLKDEVSGASGPGGGVLQRRGSLPAAEPAAPLRGSICAPGPGSGARFMWSPDLYLEELKLNHNCRTKGSM